MHTKKLEELSLDELAEIHLSKNTFAQPLADGSIRSVIGQMILEICQTSGITNTSVFSPIYGVFAILDQVGSAYINKKMDPYPDSNASGVKKALYYFCGISDLDEIKAIYGLRNSLIHDGSVLYRGLYRDGKWKGPFHHFIFDNKIKGLVELPASSWDGEFSTLSNDKRTRINKDKLIELAYNAVSNAKELLDEGRLGIVLEKREIELYYKYLFHTKNP